MTGSDQDLTRISRRGFLAAAGATAGAVLLDACGGSRASSRPAVSNPTGPGGMPRRGGVLKVAAIGGSNSDTLNPLAPITTVDFARVNNLYDTLFEFDDDARVVPVLATGATPNKDSTEWTIELRPGVTFHNGRPLTADDVIYTLQTVLNPKNPMEGAPLLGPIDRNRMKKIDDRTLRLYFDAPFVILPEVFPCGFFGIIPSDWTEKNPIGTGPFKYKSFTPGSQSVFVRNDDYWQHGVPYIDELQVINYASENSQIDALLSGQVQMANSLGATQAQQVRESTSADVYSSKTGSWIGFNLNMDTFPFRSRDMRQAVKLLVDRQSMLNVLFSGEGAVAYDTYSPYDPLTDKNLPKVTQDVEQAKSLMKRAGYGGEKIVLSSYAVGPATDLMSQLLAEQANQAGMNISIDQITVTQGYATGNSQVLAPNYWFYFPYLLQAASTVIESAAYNQAHYRSARYNSIFQSAIRSADENKRREYVAELQQLDQQDGAYMVPIYPPIISAATKEVGGVQTSKVGVDFGNWNLKEVWLV